MVMGLLLGGRGLVLFPYRLSPPRYTNNVTVGITNDIYPSSVTSSKWLYKKVVTVVNIFFLAFCSWITQLLLAVERLSYYKFLRKDDI